MSQVNPVSRYLHYPSQLLSTVVPLLAAALLLLSMPAAAQQSVEQWKKYETSIGNSSWSGNPYDIVLTAEFTHGSSGQTMTQYGFYAGNDTWKIWFMPDKTGQWSWVTSSSDSDLDNRSGSFTATEATITGPVRPSGTRWYLDNGTAIAPTILAVGPYVRANGIGETGGMIDWANQVAGATYLGTTLLNFQGDSPYTDSQEDRMYIDGSLEGEEFYLPAWDRSNDFYDAARDAGMGHYIMVFSDDGSRPDSHGLPAASGGAISNEEKRLFRYLVARFAPYPKVIWDSGIDIGENRSNTWINNFVNWFHQNDPWQHPIASRTGGGSGGTHPSSADYYSDGDKDLPSRSDLVSRVEGRNVPTAMTDRYRENYSSGRFNGGREKIREAAWQMALTYGTAVYFGGSDAGGYLVGNYANDFEAAPDLGHLRRFLENNVKDFSSLTPNDAVVASGDAWVASNGTDEFLVYSRSGSSFSLALALSNAGYSVTWIDPTSGQIIAGNPVSGNGTFSFTKPGANAVGDMDWGLLISSDSMAKVPNPTRNLQAQ